MVDYGPRPNPPYGLDLIRGTWYLRTVIVTAAVYLGFISQLAPLHLTFKHRAGVLDLQICEQAMADYERRSNPPYGEELIRGTWYLSPKFDFLF